MRVDLPSSTEPAVEKRRRSRACSSARKPEREKSDDSSSSVAAEVDILEVALAFLKFHGAFLVVVDDAIGAFGRAEGEQLGDDLGQRVGIGANGAGAGAATERTKARTHHLRV